MKAKVFILTMMATVLATATFASKFPSMIIVNIDEKKALVTLNTGDAKDLEWTVINNEGDILYYKKTQNAESEVKKVFDFSERGDGNYKVCVCFDDNIVYRELIVNRNKMRIGDEVKTHKPVFQYFDEMLTVTCLNPSREKVSLQIYRNGEYFFQHNVGKDLAMHKTFDISGLRNGNYIFVIKDNNGRYEYNLQMGY